MREATVHLVAKRINYSRHSITVNSVAWFLDRSCASTHGEPMHEIDIGNVYVERATSRPASFERPHNRNDRVADTNCHVDRLASWRVLPVQQLSVEHLFQKRVQPISVFGRKNRCYPKAIGQRVNCHMLSSVPFGTLS